jgi:hypothetical protein
MAGRVDTVTEPMEMTRFDETLDADTGVAQELLKLADRDDAVLSPSELPEPPPPLTRATYVTAPRAWATLVINRFTRVARTRHA